MRVAVVSEYFYPDNSGGTPTDLSDLSRALKAKYGDLLIDVITSRNLYRSAGIPGRLPRFEYWAGLDIKRLRVPKSNRPSMMLRLFFGAIFSLAALVELLRRRRYDMIFIVTNPPGLAGAAWIYSRITGVRYLYLVHDLYPDIAVAMGKLGAESPLVRVFRRLQRIWLSDAGRVVVLGRCMKQHLLSIYHLDASAVTVIPSWGATAVSRHEETVNEFRLSLGFPGTVALYAGNFSEYSRIEIFLEAAWLLRGRPDLLFVLIGDGSRRTAIENEIESKGLSNVRLLPRVPREMMGHVLGGCDIALLSLDERMLGLGVPSKLYTILAAGRAVLAVVPVGSEVALVLKEENCGINSVPNSPAQVAAELAKLIDSQATLRELGANAKRALEGKYTIENACNQFHSQIERCVALPDEVI